MPILSEHAVFILIAQLGLIVLAARIFGEIAIRLGQPIIVGEVVAGILLGPAIVGHFFPEFHSALFPTTGHQPYVLQGISWLCVMFLLLITGLEIDFRASLRQGQQSIAISFIALFLCFAGVFAASNFLPGFLFPDGIDPLHVRLLLSIGLSVVAIPVIAKILFDLKIIKSEVGLIVLTSGVLSDVWGWVIVAIIMSLISTGVVTVATVVVPLVTMFLYLGFTLTVGQKFVDKLFSVISYKENDATTALSLLFSLALINGAIAHLLHIHVVFGAFVAGIMAGESKKITPFMRQWLQDFIFAIFAPIFFVLIGMQLTFSNAASWIPIILLLVASSICRIAGAYIGGIWKGLGRKNAFAVACGLNTQGTMGIIVALIGYDLGIFNEQMFSVIVIVCILTSLGVGPLLKWAMKGLKRPLAKFFDRDHVFLNVEGASMHEVVDNMVQLMADRKIITNIKETHDAILEREEMLSTAIGEGVALPHARMEGIKKPVLCFFRLKQGIDYGSPDGKPVQLLFLELTDSNDDGMQLNLIAQVARFISSTKNRDRLLQCKGEEEVHHVLSLDERA